MSRVSCFLTHGVFSFTLHAFKNTYLFSHGSYFLIAYVVITENEHLGAYTNNNKKNITKTSRHTHHKGDNYHGRRTSTLRRHLIYSHTHTHVMFARRRCLYSVCTIVLGPLLLLVYINDIKNACPDTNIKLFDDDANFCC